MKLFISPHSDDAVLFGAYTLMREHPLVLTVTDGFIQANRGENVTADQRWLEDIKAMKILGCPLIFGNIRDDIIDEWAVKDLLSRFYNFDTVYAPSVQGGNPQHDLIGRLAKERFKNVIQYSTYAKGEWFTKGTKAIKPTLKELKLKDEALSCYRSQWDLTATRGHFEASLKARSEWML
jgi:LmbE family N-acetylglucosaminyl deacetylase